MGRHFCQIFSVGNRILKMRIYIGVDFSEVEVLTCILSSPFLNEKSLSFSKIGCDFLVGI